MKVVALAVAAVIGGLFTAVFGTFLLTFFVMLLFGAVHAEVFTWVPALGFVQTFLVLLLIRLLLPTPATSSN